MKNWSARDLPLLAVVDGTQGGKKRCRTCRQELPATLEFFSRNPKNADRLQKVCKGCYNAYAFEWRTKKDGHGLTLDFQAIVAIQDGKCAICQQGTRLVPDHNHATGEFRAGLCPNCNKMIGHAQEDPATLRAAARYLELQTPHMEVV